jgi:TonB family protein
MVELLAHVGYWMARAMLPPRPSGLLLPLAVALSALAPAAAWAQPAPAVPPAASPLPGPAPVVTMPVVKQNEGVTYPKAALDAGIHDTVEVSLILTIDATGVVTRAVVEKPVGHGFDEAAVEAAQKLTFDPATRDGKPVAAKTRFVYRFTPPAAALAGRVVSDAGERPIAGATVVVRDAAGQEQTTLTGADGSWRLTGLPPGTYHIKVSATGRATHEADETVQAGEEASAVDRLALEAPATVPGVTKPEEEVEEVEVHGEKPPREVTKRTLDQRELSRIPGTNGDALRSLQNLPGVARPPAFLGLLIVRGSAPEDTQYFIDGTPVPLVYHFGGLTSVVPTEMVNKLDFYPGNFSSQYGRAMGGIVDVGLANPKDDRIHALVQADFIDARLMVQGPIADTGWKFAVGARRSNLDLWLTPVLQATAAGVSVTPVYYDYQAVAERDLGKKSSIRFALFGSDDKLDVFLPTASSSEPDLAGTLGTHTGFWRGQGLYRNKLSDDTELRVVGAVGQDYVELNAGSIFFNLTEWNISSRVELAQKLAKNITMNMGIDLMYLPYTLSAQLPPLPKPGQPPAGPFSGQPPLSTNVSGALYEPAFYGEMEAVPWTGGRIVSGVRVDYTKDTSSWDISPRLVVRQDVANDPRTTLKGGVGLFQQPPQPQETNPTFGMGGLTSNRAYHYDVGVEHEFTPQIEASLEGFYKQLDNLVELGLGNTGSGQVIGAETLIKYKPDERFFGWIAYTLSQSERRQKPGAPLMLFQYDETHILTVLGSYRLGKGWEFGMRYRLSSGYMYTPDGYGFYDENIGTYLPLASYPAYNTRLPLFHALDVRVDKTWEFRWCGRCTTPGKFSAYLDILNVYNQGNVDGVSYDYNNTHTAYANDLPIIPSLGVRLEY